MGLQLGHLGYLRRGLDPSMTEPRKETYGGKRYGGRSKSDHGQCEILQ